MAANAAAPTRTRLSRDLIVATTRRVLDRSGLDGLSMRVIGDELGTSPMALYRHFEDRRDLEMAVVRRVSEELILEDDPSIDPHEAIGNWMRSFRAHWRRYPWFGPMLQGHEELSDILIDAGTGLALALSRTGADPTIVGQQVALIMRTTIGIALVEQTAALPRAEDMPPLPADFPHRAVADAALSIDDDEVFELVIHGVVAGLDARVAAPNRTEGLSP